MVKIERNTYSLLEWLGDVGGLFDGLVLIAHFSTSPIVVFALKTELLNGVQASKGKEKASEKCCDLFKSNIRRQNRRKINKAYELVTQELDLIKFLRL